MQHMKIDISLSTILKIVFVVLALWLLFTVKDIAVMFFIVLILAAALNPFVDKMSRYIPRLLVVLLIGIIFIGLLVGFGFLIVPPLVSEIKALAISLPLLSAKMGPLYHTIQSSISTYQDTLINASSQIGKVTTGIFSTTIGFISGIFTFITIIILSFYMLLEKKEDNFIYNLFEESKRERIKTIVGKIGEKLGQWVRGQLFLMLTIGVLYGIALSILGVPFALILAVWGGLTEVIPYLGPWLGLIPAVLVAFTVSPWTALIVVIVYLVIQQLESTLLVPKIVGKAVGLSPVIVILSMLIGAKLMGIIGVVVAVPIAATISVILQNWQEIKSIGRS